jgi:NAD+ synthase
MTGDIRRHQQESIIAELGVPAEFDARDEIQHRVQFLVERLRETGTRGYVLGISGGVDSCTAGRLCQLAVERAREGGGQARFLAMRLPYGVQADEANAQRALAFIRPDAVLTVDIAPTSDALTAALRAAGEPAPRTTHEDVVLGNIKARERMTAQYAVANAHGMLVVGTDHAAEAVTGFFTKYGDGGCDLTPLAGLTKRRVRAIARALGADEAIVNKVPTADLETARPGLPDETALGLSYDDIDDFLEGLEIGPQVHETIVATYHRTAHKRAQPLAPSPSGRYGATRVEFASLARQSTSSEADSTRAWWPSPWRRRSGHLGC